MQLVLLQHNKIYVSWWEKEPVSKFIGQSCYPTPLQLDLRVHRDILLNLSTRDYVSARTAVTSLPVQKYILETSRLSLLVANESDRLRMNSSELNFCYICLLRFFLIVAKYLFSSLINRMLI